MAYRYARQVRAPPANDQVSKLRVRSRFCLFERVDVGCNLTQDRTRTRCARTLLLLAVRSDGEGCDLMINRNRARSFFLLICGFAKLNAIVFPVINSPDATSCLHWIVPKYAPPPLGPKERPIA